MCIKVIRLCNEQNSDKWITSPGAKTQQIPITLLFSPSAAELVARTFNKHSFVQVTTSVNEWESVGGGQGQKLNSFLLLNADSVARINRDVVGIAIAGVEVAAAAPNL